MMNIRLHTLMKKISTRNKSIQILDIFGFGVKKYENKSIFAEQKDKTLKNINFESEEIKEVISTAPEINKSSNFFEDIDNSNKTLTKEFEPTNITEQFKAIWINLEQRRKWLYPSILIFSTFVLLSIVASTLVKENRIEEENLAQSQSLAIELNQLYPSLNEIIDVSTSSFFSKYDISNASASLQQIESSLIQYKNQYNNISIDFISNEYYNDRSEIDQNIYNLSQLIDQLDLLVAYRISNTEILIYPVLPAVATENDITALTDELSGISATSLSNYESLPEMSQFVNHKETLAQALEIASDLHGRYLAALRNQEENTASSLAISIELNKKTVQNVFNKNLANFKIESQQQLERIKPLP